MFKPKTFITELSLKSWKQNLRDASIRLGNYSYGSTNNFDCTFPIATMHLRHGDKVFGSTKNRPETRYIPVFEGLQILDSIWNNTKLEANQRHCFFIATSNPVVRSIIRKKWSEITKRNIVPLFSAESQGNDFSTIDLINGKLNATEVMLSTLQDIISMLQADIFLGTMDSNLSRLVAELGATKWKLAPIGFKGPGWYVNP